MPGFNISGVGGGPPNTVETLRNHRWVIQTLGPIRGGKDDTTLVARELTLPRIRFDTQEVVAGTLYYKYAKSVKWEDVTVTLYDTGDIWERLQEWRDLVHTNEAGIKSHAPNQGYKKDCIFILLDGKDDQVIKVILRQSWPSYIDYGKLSYTSSDIKIIELTLSYDFAESLLITGPN